MILTQSLLAIIWFQSLISFFISCGVNPVSSTPSLYQVVPDAPDNKLLAVSLMIEGGDGEFLISIVNMVFKLLSHLFSEVKKY